MSTASSESAPSPAGPHPASGADGARASAETERQQFLDTAAAGRPSLFREVGQFLSESRKWWLIPLFVALAILGALAAFGSSTAGPFVYSFF